MLYLKTLLGKLPRRGKLSITPHVSVGSHDNRQMRLGETRSRIPCVIIHWRHALFLLLLHYWERVHPGRRIWYCLMQPQTALRLSGVIESMCLRHIWVKNLVSILFINCLILANPTKFCFALRQPEKWTAPYLFFPRLVCRQLYWQIMAAFMQATIKMW